MADDEDLSHFVESLPEELLERIVRYVNVNLEKPYLQRELRLKGPQLARLGWEAFCDHLQVLSNGVIQSRGEFQNIMSMWDGVTEHQEGERPEPECFKANLFVMDPNNPQRISRPCLDSKNKVVYDMDGKFAIVREERINYNSNVHYRNIYYTLLCLCKAYTAAQESEIQLNLGMDCKTGITQMPGTSLLMYFNDDDWVLWDIGDLSSPNLQRTRRGRGQLRTIRPHPYKNMLAAFWLHMLQVLVPTDVANSRLNMIQSQQYHFRIGEETAEIRDVYWLIHQDQDLLVAMQDGTVTRRRDNRQLGYISVDDNHPYGLWIRILDPFCPYNPAPNDDYDDPFPVFVRDLEVKNIEIMPDSYPPEVHHFVRFYNYPQHRCIISVDFQMLVKTFEDTDEEDNVRGIITRRFPLVHKFKMTKIHDSAYRHGCNWDCSPQTTCACTLKHEFEFVYPDRLADYNETLVHGALMSAVMCDNGPMLLFIDLLTQGRTEFDLRRNLPPEYIVGRGLDLRTCVRPSREKWYLLALTNSHQTTTQFLIQQYEWSSRQLMRNFLVPPVVPEIPIPYSLLRMEVDFTGIFVYASNDSVHPRGHVFFYLQFDRSGRCSIEDKYRI